MSKKVWIWIGAGVLVVLIGAAFYVYYTANRVKRMGIVADVDKNQSIEKKPNVTYKSLDSKKLKMDIYTPSNSDSDQKYPVMFLIHGEGPERMIKDAKNWKLYEDYAKWLASNGIAAVAFNRRSAGTNYEYIDNPTQDIIDAVQFITDNADEYNIDSSRLGAWTFSMGGIYNKALFDEKTSNIKTIVSYYSYMDIKYATSDKSELLTKYYPDNILSNSALNSQKKMLIVDAVQDSSSLNESIVSFKSSADKFGLYYESLTHTSGGHVFEALVDNEETKRILDSTMTFIINNI